MEPKKKILIVEDEVLNAMSLKMSFKKHGYDVCKLATTGEESIQITDQENPDLIIMDINLAGHIDGLMAAELIRKKYETPVIFLTGYSDTETLKKVSQFVYSICIIKPVNPEIIIKAVEKLLSGNDARDS